MPSLWKKVKSTRFSQLVNNHLHISQKRRDASSLVVETGFPASLIDLFFKNREKLKKPSKKKRRSRPATPPADVYVGSPVSYPSPPPPFPVGSPVLQRHSLILPSCVDEICVPESSGSGGGAAAVEKQTGEESGGGEVSGVLIVAIKVFVVAVLAVLTKRLTVGITILAVLLLLLEYLGKHRRLLKTPAMPIVRCKSSEPEHQLECSKCSVQESQSVQTTAGVEEIQPEKETGSNSINRNRLEYQENELLEMAIKIEESADSNRETRKAKIKSNIQKIVPKKFRRSKKEQEEQCEIVEESENETISSTSSVSERSYRESGTICFDLRLSDAKEEADTKIDEKGATEVALGRRYMLLCLIVLVGLIGGRSFALVLTLSGLLLLKFVKCFDASSVQPG